AEMLFHNRSEFPKRLVVLADDEVGIVSESVLPSGSSSDPPATGRFHIQLDRPGRVGNRNMADIPRTTFFIRNLFQLGDQLRIVCFVSRIFPAEPGGINAGSPLESIDL